MGILVTPEPQRRRQHRGRARGEAGLATIKRSASGIGRRKGSDLCGGELLPAAARRGGGGVDELGTRKGRRPARKRGRTRESGGGDDREGEEFILQASPTQATSWLSRQQIEIGEV